MYGCRICDFDLCGRCQNPLEYEETVDSSVTNPSSLGGNVKPKQFNSSINHPGAVCKVRKSWVPLESNPDLLNTYLSKLGMEILK